MNLFFDTSAIVKFFHEEEGTKTVTELITSSENGIWILEITRLEFISAVFRKYRNGEIDDKKLDNAISAFEEQLAFFDVEPIGRAITKEAESLLKEFGKTQGLRTLDALQLGCFSLISEEDWVFVAADDNLCGVAQLIGVKAINPLEKDRW